MLKLNTIQFFAFILISATISSCSIIGLNLKRKAPHKAGKYPAFHEQDSLKGNLSKYRACFDVTLYDLHVDIDPNKKYITGLVNIHLTATHDFDTIQLDLSKKMALNDVKLENQTLSYYRKYDAFFVVFKRKIKEGEKINLSVSFEGSPSIAKRPPWEGGFVWKKDKEKNAWLGVACELSGASLWWPLKDHLTDEPDSAYMHFTVPKGLFCVSNGQLVGREEKNEKETFIWKVVNPINTYNITFYIGKYESFQIPYKNHQLTFYVNPKNVEKAKEHFKQSVNMLAFFEKTFGEYAYWDDGGYKLVESPYDGMEHQTAIAYGNRYKNGRNGFDYIILHETAHEWWGNSISVADYADIWLHEGFATYSEALYVEHTQGFQEYLRYLYIYSLFIKNKRPMVGPKNVNYWNYKDGDPYMKGALTLLNLRSTIDNDVLFFDILKTFQEKHRNKIVTSDDFINLVNEKTQKDYQWFFNQFLYNRKPPKLVYSVKNDANSIEFTYKWEDVDTHFVMPIILNINNREVRLTPGVKEQTYMINSNQFSIDKMKFYFTIKEIKPKK